MKRRRTALLNDPPASVMAHVRGIELGALLAADSGRALEPWELTIHQYNLLRVLYVRDPERAGIASGELGASLVSRVPDITRFLDRLAKRGLVERVRTKKDRRTVLCRLTDAGADAVEGFHPTMLARNKTLFAHMSEAEVQQLANLLERVLEGAVNRDPD